MSTCTSYVPTHTYIADMRTKKVSKCAELQNEAFLVKIANSNVMPTLREFRWYLYFGSGVVSGIRGKQMMQ